MKHYCTESPHPLSLPLGTCRSWSRSLTRCTIQSCAQHSSGSLTSYEHGMAISRLFQALFNLSWHLSPECCGSGEVWGGGGGGREHGADDVLVDGTGPCLWSFKLHPHHLTCSALRGFLSVPCSVTSIELNILETLVEDYMLQLKYSWVKPDRITESMSWLYTA